MHYKFSGINEAFSGIVHEIDRGIKERTGLIVPKTSRNGNVYKFAEPVLITYENPRDRVLLNKARDCNPFFHMYEALWMLAGRNDVAPLSYYNSKIKDFSDNGWVFNAAYGYRWRNTIVHGVDQINFLVEHIKQVPETRRAVLQMWNIGNDLWQVGSPGEFSKDVACNTNAYFQLRTISATTGGFVEGGPEASVDYALDMTVCNRSNDAIWGMLGANYVHFSILQEYMAERIGVKVGRYNQFTNDLHVYEWNWKPDEWLRAENGLESPRIDSQEIYGPMICTDDQGIKDFVEENKDGNRVSQGTRWGNVFLDTVAQPMCHAFHMYKDKDWDAANYWLARVEAYYWRVACINWIEKRKNKAVSNAT